MDLLFLVGTWVTGLRAKLIESNVLVEENNMFVSSVYFMVPTSIKSVSEGYLEKG